MNLDEFKAYLDKNEIRYRESGVSLVLQNCPECGSSSNRVILRVHGDDIDDSKPFFGSCKRGSCGQGYSSISYLLRSGCLKSEVLSLHGMDPTSNLKAMSGVMEGVFAEALHKQEQRIENHFDYNELKDFVDINSWPDHPVAKYAFKRGFTPSFSSMIKMDLRSEAVVFLVFSNDGRVIGYQKRFVFPRDGQPKTKTSMGFKKTENLLIYQRHKQKILVCEGPFTALSAWHYGYTGVCTFGASVSGDQLKQIAKLGDTGMQIGVAAENDEAGGVLVSCMRSYLYREHSKEIFVVKPNSGKDINDAWQASSGIVESKQDDWAGPAMPIIKFF